MTDLDKYLIPAENAIVQTHRHWASLLKIGAICGGVFVVGLLLLGLGGDGQPIAVLAVLVMLASVAVFAWNYAEWRVEQFVVTDRRVLLIYGILTRKVGVMPLGKVTDLTYERSLAGRLLGYGAFVVESAGQHQAFSRIDFLPTPDQLYHDVSTLLFEHMRYDQRRYTYPTVQLPRD